MLLFLALLALGIMLTLLERMRQGLSGKPHDLIITPA